jgi:hypothetical protein
MLRPAQIWPLRETGMISQSYFILTAEQRATAMTLANEAAGAGIDPRIIDAIGATRPGEYVLPRRVVDDPAIQEHAPELVFFLLMLPNVVLTRDAIFAPVADA